MQHVQGYTGSHWHWTPPSGNCLLRIAPVATRVMANKTLMRNLPTLLAVLMVMMVCQYDTVLMAVS